MAPIRLVLNAYLHLHLHLQLHLHFLMIPIYSAVQEIGPLDHDYVMEENCEVFIKSEDLSGSGFDFFFFHRDVSYSFS